MMTPSQLRSCACPQVLIFGLTLSSLLIAPLSAQLVISEFLARNETGLTDASGQRQDWIEIHNPTDAAVALENWSLTDDQERPGKWDFPSAMIGANERIVVFASGTSLRDPEGEWHTNFRLSASGEYLALSQNGEPEPATEFAPAYPPQFDDISYGTGDDGWDGFLITPTPDAANNGRLNAGPLIEEVSFVPEVPAASEDVTVTARLVPTDSPVMQISLKSKVMYKGESTTAMTDDGTGADLKAGDGLYTGVIIGRTLFGPKIPPGDMLRWRIEATDESGAVSVAPPFLDQEGTEQSAEYFGVVIPDPEIETSLNLFHWFTDDERNAGTRTGARASLSYNGNFYDNIYVRQRGGATNGSSQKFNFNNNDPVAINEAMPAVKELNLNAQGSDPTYLRQPLAFESYRWAGNASCLSFIVRMQVNGEFDRNGILIEQVDEDFLDRNGYNPEGDLYKLVQRSNLNPVFADTTTGVEKKTNDLRDLSSLQTLVDGLKLEGSERHNFLMDALDLPQITTYTVMRSITQDADDVRKNFYVYNDIHGKGEWAIFPWDKDWTFGITGDGGQHLKHPFFGDEAHRKDNANQWNRLYDAFFSDVSTKQMMLRRLRTLMD
ncbi:MAG: CotH kinase family protein, partial [Verrucomicrobiota bacterium]